MVALWFRIVSNCKNNVSYDQCKEVEAGTDSVEHSVRIHDSASDLPVKGVESRAVEGSPDNGRESHGKLAVSTARRQQVRSRAESTMKSKSIAARPTHTYEPHAII
jgi:hypothetical protein